MGKEKSVGGEGMEIKITQAHNCHSELRGDPFVKPVICVKIATFEKSGITLCIDYDDAYEFAAKFTSAVDTVAYWLRHELIPQAESEVN